MTLTHVQPSNAILRQRFGGAVSNVLADPACATFAVPHIEGVIAYRRGLGCAVAIGDPVAARSAAAELAEHFRGSCAERGLGTVLACTSEALTSQLLERGYGAVEYGEELILDPRRDPQAGSRGRELRKKVSRARKGGLSVAEYQPGLDAGTLEASMEEIGRRWLAGRSGPQSYIAPVLLFAESSGRRWFHVHKGAEMVGVLSLVRLDAYGGWLFEHLLAVPDAPQGTTEFLVTTALEALRSEECEWATFGPSTIGRVGRLHRIGGCSKLLARATFGLAGRFIDFAAHTRYRRKFQPVRSEPSYLLFHPPRFGLREALSLFRAFNFSLSVPRLLRAAPLGDEQGCASPA